jgi:hypothetical protein
MFYLKRNLPTIERVLRGVAGVAAAVVAYAWLPSGAAAVAGWAAAAVLVGSAVVGFCPACAMMGRSPVDAKQ